MDQEMMQSSNTEKTRYYCRLFRDGDFRNKLSQIERTFVVALENNDVQTIEQMLSSNEISLPHKIGRHPIHALIMRSFSPNMIKMAVRNYPDVFLGRPDRFIELTTCNCVWDAECGTPTHWMTTSSTSACGSDTRTFEIIDLLIELHRENTSNMHLMETVFSQCGHVYSLFTRTCGTGNTRLVTKFLDLITDVNREHLSEDWFHCNKPYPYPQNLFHFADMLPVDLVKTIIDRLPFSRSLLNTNRSDPVVGHPLFTLVFHSLPNSASIARLYVLHGGAQVDPLNYRGMTPLLKAIERGNLEMVEYFLRMGARTDIVDREGNTALSLALRSGDGTHPNAKNGSLRMVELLLAFGVDLGKEACLRTAVPPNPNPKDPHNKSLRELLCDLRDSNSMNSMARLCRKVIRRQMGPNADEKIKEGISASELPKHLKSYLLVENEPPVLSGQVGQ